MNGTALTLIAIALGLVVITLFMGLFVMARGGAVAAKYSNRLMRLRVVFQAIAVVLVLIAFLMARGS